MGHWAETLCRLDSVKSTFLSRLSTTVLQVPPFYFFSDFGGALTWRDVM